MADKNIGAYSPATAQWVLDELKRQIRRGALWPPGWTPPPNPPPPTPWYIRNVSGEEIPAYACVQITGTVRPSGDRTYLNADKPADSDGTAGWFAFNSPEAVPYDEDEDTFGVCQVGPHVRVLGPSSTAGDKYQPTPGAWTVEQDDEGFLIAAGPDDLRSGTDVQRMFLSASAGSSGLFIIFTITDVSSSGIISSGITSGDKASCENRDYDAPSQALASVDERPCGSTKVPLETDEGTVTVFDDLGSFLADREVEDIIGKRGIAMLFTGDSSSSSGGGECRWVITFIDWWRWVTVLKDWTIEDGQIVKSYARLMVWDHCFPPNQTIDLFICPTDASESSSVGDAALLETGDALLLETGDSKLLEG